MPFFRSLVEMLTGGGSQHAGSQNEFLREFGEGVGAVGGDDHGVLDADAAHAGEVHAGLDGHDANRAPSVPRALAATRGSSWISRPDAVAGPVHERVAPTGGARSRRDRRGRPSAQSTPARTASRPARWLSRTTSQTCRASGPGSPTLTVRVMSEQYPSTMQPKSMTTSSPGSTRRSLGRACGFAAVRAGRDDRVEAVAARAPAAHLDLEVEREVAFGRPLGQRGSSEPRARRRRSRRRHGSGRPRPAP